MKTSLRLGRQDAGYYKGRGKRGEDRAADLTAFCRWREDGSRVGTVPGRELDWEVRAHPSPREDTPSAPSSRTGRGQPAAHATRTHLGNSRVLLPDPRHPSERTAIGGARRRETSITKPTLQIKAPRLQSEEGSRPGPQRSRHPHVRGPCARAPPDGSTRHSNSIISPGQMGKLRHGVCAPRGAAALQRSLHKGETEARRGRAGSGPNFPRRGRGVTRGVAPRRGRGSESTTCSDQPLPAAGSHDVTGGWGGDRETRAWRNSGSHSPPEADLRSLHFRERGREQLAGAHSATLHQRDLRQHPGDHGPRNP